jgi:hypothetical protein
MITGSITDSLIRRVLEAAESEPGARPFSKPVVIITKKEMLT